MLSLDHSASLPGLLERVAEVSCRCIGREPPQRVVVRRPEGPVVGEDLDVVQAVPAHGVERTQDLGDVAHAVAGQGTIGEAASGLAAAGDVHADEAVVLRSDVVVQRVRVPEVPGVELQAERERFAGVLDQRDRLGDRGDDSPRAAADVPAILRTLSDAGWDGLYDIEIFSDDGTFGSEYSDSFWAAPAGETLARALAAFERCWSIVETLTPQEVEESR